MIIQTYVLGTNFLKNEQSEPVTLRKTMVRVVANDKSWLSFWKLELWKICTHHHELDSSPVLKVFPDEVSNKAGIV